jgi:hypothetical protein
MHLWDNCRVASYLEISSPEPQLPKRKKEDRRLCECFAMLLGGC